MESRCSHAELTPKNVAATEVPPYLGAPRAWRAARCWWSAWTWTSSRRSTKYLDRIGVIPGASVYPFVWNILLAARNEGYGGVLTTMAVAEEPRVKELLGIPDDLCDRCCPADRQAGEAGQQAHRKPVAEIASRERFDGRAVQRLAATRRSPRSASMLTLDNSSAVSQTQWAVSLPLDDGCHETLGS